MAVQFFINPVGAQVNLDVLWGTFVTNCLVSSCLLPLFIYDSVKYSHRFVGPILRLHTQMRQVGVVPVKPICLRSDDFWQEVATEFNSMLHRIESRLDGADTSRAPAEEVELPALCADDTHCAEPELATSSR